MPAIPIIGMGIGAVSSFMQARAASKAAKGMEALQGKQTGLSDELAGFARGQHTMAEPALQKAMQYYMTLASGSRGAINSALAPDRAALTDTYSGAERGMTANMAAGPGRDRAIAELYRKKAGQMGLMPFMARQNAVGNLNQMGSDAMQRALSAYGGANSALTGAGNTGVNAMNARSNANSMWGNFFGNATGAATGIYDWYKRRGSSGRDPNFQSYSF